MIVGGGVNHAHTTFNTLFKQHGQLSSDWEKGKVRSCVYFEVKQGFRQTAHVRSIAKPEPVWNTDGNRLAEDHFFSCTEKGGYLKCPDFTFHLNWAALKSGRFRWLSSFFLATFSDLHSAQHYHDLENRAAGSHRVKHRDRSRPSEASLCS